MIGKVFWSILATVVIIFGLVAFWPAFMEGVSSANTSYNATSNYTGLNEAIRFSPVAIWLGVLALPIIAIILVLYARRTGGS